MTHRGPFQPLQFCDTMPLQHELQYLASFKDYVNRISSALMLLKYFCNSPKKKAGDIK